MVNNIQGHNDDKKNKVIIRFTLQHSEGILLITATCLLLKYFDCRNLNILNLLTSHEQICSNKFIPCQGVLLEQPFCKLSSLVQGLQGHAYQYPSIVPLLPTEQCAKNTTELGYSFLYPAPIPLPVNIKLIKYTEKIQVLKK